MATIRVTSSTTALKAAAEVIAAATRVVAGKFSSKIPGVVHSYLGTGGFTAFVAAGHKGGKWGWTPINAWMFEEPHGSSTPKHPVFATGPRKTWGKWYYQPYRPFMEEGAAAGADQAAKIFADLSIDKWLGQTGWK
jgi:hypothetical protein